MRGQYDCNDQDFWSKYVIKKWGDKIDPYWTTSLNENGDLEDVLYVKKSIRYKE